MSSRLTVLVGGETADSGTLNPMKRSKKRANHDARDTVLLALVGALAVLFLAYFFPTVLVNYLALKLLPLQMSARPSPKTTGAVVIAAIDYDTTRRLGSPPWPAGIYTDGHYIARDLGLIRVKGKKQAVAIYEVVGPESEGTDRSFYSDFSEALHVARQARSADAFERLQRLAEVKPGDVALALYLDLLRSHKALGPDELVLEFSMK
jgi:hypothetical protein